jgi:hypothetical protein
MRSPISPTEKGSNAPEFSRNQPSEARLRTLGKPVPLPLPNVAGVGFEKPGFFRHLMGNRGDVGKANRKKLGFFVKVCHQLVTFQVPQSEKIDYIERPYVEYNRAVYHVRPGLSVPRG